jgi:GNAT superfamily N-acetyltransferase
MPTLESCAHTLTLPLASLETVPLPEEAGRDFMDADSFTLPPMTVRFASRADLEPAALVLQNAARRLEATGEGLWHPESFTAETLEPRLTAGELCVATLEGHIVGVMFLQASDALFWPDEPDGESLFVHKLAVENAYRGQGVARALLEFSRTEAAARGRRWVRLDCADRVKLRAVYEGFGFQYRDLKTVNGFRVCRYELPI